MYSQLVLPPSKTPQTGSPNKIRGKVRPPTNHPSYTLQKWELCALGTTFFVTYTNTDGSHTILTSIRSDIPYKAHCPQ